MSSPKPPGVKRLAGAQHSKPEASSLFILTLWLKNTTEFINEKFFTVTEVAHGTKADRVA